MTMLLLTTTAALLHPTAAADVTINWQMDMITTATAQRGDTLNFVWSGTKPVGQVATQAEFDACSGLSKDRTGTSSPSQVVVDSETPDGFILYFIGTRSGHCADKGYKVAVTINGGAGGTAGQCFSLACRTIGGQNTVLGLDYQCCSIADAHGYTASCADGYTYHQWAFNDEGDACDSPMTGTCCVVDGGTVPAGAELPSSGGDGEVFSERKESSSSTALVPLALPLLAAAFWLQSTF